MNLFRHFATAALVACSLVGAGSMSTASAELITYTLSGGTIDGSLNGTPFTGKSFTMTVSADPTSFTVNTDSGATLYYQLAAPTMTIDGFSPFTITQSSYELFVVDYASLLPGSYAGGFGVFNSPNVDDNFTSVGGGIYGGSVTGDPINGPGSITGIFVTTDPTLATSAGTLSITSNSDAGATFTASSPSAVPEIDPSCLGSVLALLGGGLGLLERRRKRA